MPSVYDDEKTDGVTGDKLQQLEDSFAASSAPKSGSDKLQEQRDLENMYNAPSAKESGSDKLGGGNSGGKDSGSSSAGSAGKGKSDGEGADSGVVGALSAGAGALTGTAGAVAGKLVGFMKRHKKGTAGGGILAVLAGLVVGAILLLSPLKVIGIVSNIQDFGFANSNHAADKMSQNLFQYYIAKRVIPGMSVTQNCTSTKRDRSCANVGGTTNLVSALWVTWKDANLEGKLANDYGIEIQKRGNKFYMITPSTSRQGVDLGEFDSNNTRVFEGRLFTEMNRQEIRRQIRAAVETETFSRRMRFKYSVGLLLERKYNIRRCVTACTTRDRIQTAQETKLTAFKIYLAERFLMPYSESMGLALQCATTGFECGELGEADQNGERRSQYEKDLQARLIQYRADYGKKSLEELKVDADKISQYGFSEFAMRRIAGDTVGKILSKTIPFVGWIDLGARLVSGAENIGPALRQINFVMNSQAMVSVFAMMATHGDEMKTGDIDLAIAGSMASSLDANPNTDQDGGSADSSPLWNGIMYGEAPASTTGTLTLLDRIQPTASAQPADPDRQPCNEGGRSADNYVCPEMSFKSWSTIMRIGDYITAATKNPQTVFTGLVADLWLATGGAILDWLGGALDPVIAALTPEKIEQIIAWAMNSVMKRAVVNIASANPSGQRLFEMMGGGATVAGDAHAHLEQGGRVLTEQELAVINQKQYSERVASFEALPLASRLFSRDTSMSLISRVAVATPSSHSTGLYKVSSIIANPMQTFSNVFAGIIPGQKVSAAIPPGPNPFLDKIHGYPDDDPIFVGDPEVAWEELGCDNPDNKKIWGDKSSVDDLTGSAIHDETNPCMLMREEIAHNGGYLDTDLLEPVPTYGAPPTASPSTPTDGGTGLVTGTPQQLAQQIMASGKVTFNGTARYREQVEAYAAGDFSCNLNPVILQVIATISQQHTVNISSLNRYCTGVLTNSGTRSYHYRSGGGHAVDFNFVDGIHADGNTAAEITMLRFIAPKLPQNSGLGQVNCRSAANKITAPGVRQFNDTCNHVHIEVPVQ